MINHTRTLLLNRGRDGQGPDLPGEEYVVSNYHTRRLSGPVRLAHQFLFGTNPDRFFLNFRLRQLLPFIHATELDALARRKDPRITYWPFAADPFFADVFAAKVARLSGSVDPHIFGEHACNAGTGRCRETWRVEILAGAQVRVTRRTPPTTLKEHAAAYHNGLSALLPLHGSNLEIRLPATATGNSWLIESTARPQTDIGEILANLINTLGETGTGAILGEDRDPAAETLRVVWRDHPLSGYRYGALLLALADRIEASAQEA